MADEPVPDGRSGLLPPDGVAWPPEPPPVLAAPAAPASLPTMGRRPSDGTADVADWRSMPVDSPEGYRGSATAPPAPAPRVDLWCVLSCVFAAVGMLPFLLTVPLAPVLAIGFGLAGRRACTLDPTRRGRVLATIGVAVGAATLLVVVGAVANGRLTLFDI